MKRSLLIPLIIIACFARPVNLFAQSYDTTVQFDFYGDSIKFQLDKSFVIDFNGPLSTESIDSFYQIIITTNYFPVLTALSSYKESHKADDWLYYQLIRKIAQQVSPKDQNYKRYTLYKWFLLTKSGYDAILTYAGDMLLFYVRSDENIYNIPFRTKNGKQYVCLNYHDYKSIDFEKYKFSEVVIAGVAAKKIFSYKDAQGFRKKDNSKLHVKTLDAYVYHYGWVKPPEAMQAKQESFHKMWHDDQWMKENIDVTDKFDYSQIDSLAKFTGTHPQVMQERIRRQNWKFDFDPTKKKWGIKMRLLMWVEKKFGLRIGEYRNYEL